MVSTLDFESSDPSSNLGRTLIFNCFKKCHKLGKELTKQVEEGFIYKNEHRVAEEQS